MPVTIFDHLPATTQEALTAQAGVVTGFRSASHGNHAHVAGELRTENGSVFIKAAPVDDRESLYVRHEVGVHDHVGRFGPPLLWNLEAGGWYVAAWMFLDLRHPVYKPGSPDLAVVAGLILNLGTTPCPDEIDWTVESRYEGAIGASVSVLGGSTILHTDLNPSNVLINEDETAFAVDWAFCSRGAAWLECAYLMPWLIQGGHTSGEAEAWLKETFPAWRDAPEGHVDIFVRTLAQVWARRDVPEAPQWVREYAAAAQDWHQHRS
ncbi:MAG: hypothetical protein HOY79_18965 [Streptomyces sp.]|nr:hypothetical protein [Streptomyces sp.]